MHDVMIQMPEEEIADFLTGEEIESASILVLEEMHRETGTRYGYELSLSVVDDFDIQELNRDYRGKDRPTDVLSFPQIPEGDDAIQFPVVNEMEPLGDIIISHETCREQAGRIGHSVKDEFYRLLVHGILHLFGFDHEISEKEAERMREKEDEILTKLEKIE